MKLLVANRAEIALRIMSTAAALGIETVAVYPGDDEACAHVTRADASVRLPGDGPAAYLDAGARQQRYEELVAEYYEKGRALSTAAAFEIDGVIDPARTRHVLIETLARTRS